MGVNSARTELITNSTKSVMLSHQTYIARSATCYTNIQNSVLLHDKLYRANLLATDGQIQPLSDCVGRDV